MGLISDFFAASEDELKELDPSSSPVGNLAGVEAKRIDPVKLLTLQCIIDGSEFDTLLDGIDDLFLHGGEEGPWILRVPFPIVEALAGADQARLSDLARDWADTEEWRRDGGTQENLLPFLASLSSLIRDSGSTRSLYVWSCV